MTNSETGIQTNIATLLLKILSAEYSNSIIFLHLHDQCTTFNDTKKILPSLMYITERTPMKKS